MVCVPFVALIALVGSSYGVIGGLRASMPMVTWLLYPHGIGIKVELFGEVFIPTGEIGLEPSRFFMATLYHCSPEVRSPIQVPRRVAKIMAATYLPMAKL